MGYTNLTNYQKYIHLSRYARWDENLGRRETWDETVNRYVTNIISPVIKDDSISNSIQTAIENMEVMPSMRAMMTAGEAARRDNTCMYNCSFLRVDSLRAFDEAMFILMSGSGVGFSVERQAVSNLPQVPTILLNSSTCIVFEDSKEGWADGFRLFLKSIFEDGFIPIYDVSNLRPKGAILKTFGGRSSGPQPLVELLEFVKHICIQAQGRHLTSIECHDIMCKIGDIVVSGGVRRSALISLSNLSDHRMSNAKSGQWWEMYPHRALANNSTAYTEKPEILDFMNEWGNLIRSKSGERGVFSRMGAKLKCDSIGRNSDYEFGVNPCVTGDTLVHTSKGLRMVKHLIDIPFSANVNGEYYKSDGFWVTGHKDVYRLVTKSGYGVTATKDHKILIDDGTDGVWKELGDVSLGDNVILNNINKVEDINLECDKNEDSFNFKMGWILGEVVGDGNHNPNLYHSLVRFWGDDAKVMADYAFSIIDGVDANYHIPVKSKSPTYSKINKSYQVQSKKITEMASVFLTDGDKLLKDDFFRANKDFQRGFIRGVFDADGTVLFNKEKGSSVRLGQSNIILLEQIQKLLMIFGIKSKVYTNRRKGGYKELPDGKGGNTNYFCKSQHELVISRDSIVKYNNSIGFKHVYKQTKLDEIISSYVRPTYKDNFTDDVVSIEYCGKEDVYDCTVDKVHRFSANGIIVHNCGEIILRPQQLCNLSEAIIRPDDTVKSIAKKIETATIIGTIQSTYTHFPYLREEWKTNCEEERLLGVSMTGICDNRVTGYPFYQDLSDFRKVAKHTNLSVSKKLGINESAAITCVKPSGTVSELTGTASGIHPRFAPYYIRRVRGDNSDPITQFMKDAGFVHEPDVMKPDYQTVFSFPVKSPDKSLTSEILKAKDQLSIWDYYSKYFCDHNPSTTIYVRDDEWLECGDFVYKNFDKLTGLSFLPHTDHTYRQAPYEEISEDEYNKLVAKTPTDVDWMKLSTYETEDRTTGAQELACVSGVCSI